MREGSSSGTTVADYCDRRWSRQSGVVLRRLGTPDCLLLIDGSGLGEHIYWACVGSVWGVQLLWIMQTFPDTNTNALMKSCGGRCKLTAYAYVQPPPVSGGETH